MNNEMLAKVINLVNSTNEMIKLRNEEIQLYYKLNRAIIGQKLLKDQKSKEVKSIELPIKTQNILKEHGVRFGWQHGTNIKLYDSGAVEVLASIKNITTYIFIIEDNTILIPA